MYDIEPDLNTLFLTSWLKSNRKTNHSEDRHVPIASRLFLTGPLSHYFYQLMEVWMPTTDPYYIVKRLLLDRLIFAPVFLFIFYLVMNTLEVGRPTRPSPGLMPAIWGSFFLTHVERWIIDIFLIEKHASLEKHCFKLLIWHYRSFHHCISSIIFVLAISKHFNCLQLGI